MEQVCDAARRWVASGVISVVAWVLGVALLAVWPRLPSAATLHALLAWGLALGLVWAVWTARIWPCSRGERQPQASGTGRPHRRRLGPLVPAAQLALLAIAMALLAHGSTALRTALRLEQRLPHALEGVPLLVQGEVEDLPRRTPQGVQFGFRVKAAHDLAGRPVAGLPPWLWLGWWIDGPIDGLIAASVPEPRPGERWQLPVSLKRPHGMLNPGGFDAERWFLQQNLGATGSVSSSHLGLARRLGGGTPPGFSADRGRAALRERIDAHVQDDALAGLVAGLTIGDQSSVDAQDWWLFRAAGVAHALSISGAHITVFAALAAPVAAALWRRWPRGCLLCPAPWVGLWVGCGCALAYALMAGWGLPAQRTVAMLVVVCWARTRQLNWPPLVAWIVAAGPIVAIDPWAVGQASFWLSFAAVGLLLLAQAGHRAWPGSLLLRLWQALRSQALISMGLAPLAAVCFGEVSVVGVLGNLVALPWITLVLTPVCLLGLWWPLLWQALPWVVDPLRAAMAALVSLPGAVAPIPGGSAWALGSAVLGATLALIRCPLPLRLSGLLMILPLMLPPPRLPPTGQFEMWAWDVGQGSAVLVRTRHHALLLDAGPAWGEGRDAGERVVLPALRQVGVRRLDELMVTHRDLDHVGGAASVLKAMPVGQVRSSLEPSHPLLKLGVAHTPCRRGQAWQWDGVHFEVLHPLGHESPKLKPNALSCVLRVEDTQGRSLLLTGDIELEQERLLAEMNAGPSLQSDGLLVPHHGSRTSSSEGFLQAVRPRWALAQAGYRNRYGHPAPVVVQRYADRGIALWSSPWCGALRWQGDALHCWRALQPRHWHDHPPAIERHSQDP